MRVGKPFLAKSSQFVLSYQVFSETAVHFYGMV